MILLALWAVVWYNSCEIIDYIKNNYDQVRFTVKKGKKEELKEHCSKFGYKSVNDFINQAVNEKIARDLGEI